MIAEIERKRLLEIARGAIVAHIAGEPPRLATSSESDRRGAAFVTLHKQGELRGCIGRLESDELLSIVVAECACSAASADPRFPPITRDELAEVQIELSILGAFERVQALEDIAIGRHGLLVEQRHRRGLLLPQVATEWQWDARAFAEHTCRKAGLPIDAWQRGASLWRFEAEVFGDA